MKNLLPLLAAVFLLGAFGCETAPSAGGGNVTAKVDYGAYPENYEQLVRNHFGAADCRLGKPFAGYLKAGPLMGGKVLEAGYFVEVWLKGKDQSGPERRLGVLVKNGEVLMQLNSKELDEVERAR